MFLWLPNVLKSTCTRLTLDCFRRGSCKSLSMYGCISLRLTALGIFVNFCKLTPLKWEWLEKEQFISAPIRYWPKAYSKRMIDYWRERKSYEKMRIILYNSCWLKTNHFFNLLYYFVFTVFSRVCLFMKGNKGFWRLAEVKKQHTREV